MTFIYFTGENVSSVALGVAGWKGIGIMKPITNGRPMYTRGGHGGEVSLYVVPHGGGSGKYSWSHSQKIYSFKKF